MTIQLDNNTETISMKVIEKKTKKISPPFGYFGSKNKIALKLCDNLPPHSCWVEVCCGSAALTLRKEPALMEVINDIDNEIINLFEQLRNNTEELCRLIDLTPYAEGELIKARIPIEASVSKVERARRFLVQSMMSINGVFGKEKGGFSYSQTYARSGREARVNRWYNMPERLQYAAERLKNVRVHNKDAREIIKMFTDQPNTLIYLDPPYLGDRTNGYTIDANNEEFHTELLDLANKAKCMVFISGYENDLYDLKLTVKRGWEKKTIPSSTKDSTGNSHERMEVVWMNKHFIKGQTTKKLPIKLTKKETKQNKVNPKR